MDWSGSPMTNSSPAPAPGPDQPVLDIVDILKLVHQHMTEAPQAGDIPLQSFGQQVVEVPGAQVSQPGLIGVVQLASRPVSSGDTPFFTRETDWSSVFPPPFRPDSRSTCSAMVRASPGL